MKLYLLDKIGNENIWVLCLNEQEFKEHQKQRKKFSLEIKKAILILRKEGIVGNELNIKKIIYDKWGQSVYDTGGNPL